MEFLNLFWNFDADNKTKLIIFCSLVIMFLCILCKPKNNKVSHIPILQPNVSKKTNISKCQIDQKVCQVNVKHGYTNKNLCIKCKPNGNYPDKIYNSKIGWINLDPNTGQEIN
jgi:hypothetical protein